MRKTIVAIAVVGSMFAFGTWRTVAHSAERPLYRAVYRVDVGDKQRGTLEVVVNHADAVTYTVDMSFESDRRSVKGLIFGSRQRLVVRIVEGGLQLLEERASQDDNEMTATFDWEKGVATVTMNGRAREVPLRGPDNDGNRQQLAAGVYAATFWVPGDYELFGLDAGIKRTEGEPGDIQTALGAYHARRLNLETPSGAKAIFWLAPDLNGMPVMMEFPDGRRSPVFVLAELHDVLNSSRSGGLQ